MANRITIERLKADVEASQAILRKATGAALGPGVSSGFEPGFGVPTASGLSPIGDVRTIAPLGLGFAPPALPPATPAAPAPWFSAEGSGAFATAGINHESSIVKGFDALLHVFGGEKGARYGGGHDAPVSVQGDVSGQATIMQTVRVDPSPLLTAIVTGAQAVTRMNLSGKLGQTMKGSNAAQGSVPSGLSTFKPTMTGY